MSESGIGCGRCECDGVETRGSIHGGGLSGGGRGDWRGGVAELLAAGPILVGGPDSRSAGASTKPRRFWSLWLIRKTRRAITRLARLRLLQHRPDSVVRLLESRLRSRIDLEWLAMLGEANLALGRTQEAWGAYRMLFAQTSRRYPRPGPLRRADLSSRGAGPGLDPLSTPGRASAQPAPMAQGRGPDLHGNRPVRAGCRSFS